MKPTEGQNIEVFFRNGMQISGIVQTYEAKEIVLKTEHNDNLLIITPLADDILMVKIIAPRPSLQEKVIHLSELEEQFEEVYEMPNTEELRIKNLAELKTMMNKQEREILSQRMRAHIPNNMQIVQYNNPFGIK